ncbi:MAG: glycosyl hydrolase family 18 protein [Bacillota bacterium]|nr:glycosyl hydrolase family 18 protein [Bacillota bacterium]
MAEIEYVSNKKKPLPWIIGGFGLTIILLLSSILVFYPFASSEKKAFFHGVNPILFNGSQVGNAHLEGKKIYVPLAFVQKKIDNSILLDKKSKSIIITTRNKVIQIPLDSLTYFENTHPLKLQVPSFTIIQGREYISLDSILSYYSIRYKILNGTKAIWIQHDGEIFRSSSISTKEMNRARLRLRTSPSLQSPYTAETFKKEVVMVEGEKDGFYLVRKENGISGYLKKDIVKLGKKETVKITQIKQPFTLSKINRPIQLTWEAVYSKNPDYTKIPTLTGVNVVSPTWFSLNDQNGNIKNLASLDYSKWAKSKGYQVWGLFSNHFDPVLTHEALKDYETRQKLISQLLQYSKAYQLQGINFDIENVHQEDGPLVTQFLREAAPFLHDAGLVISIDITFSAADSDWSSFYERKRLSQIVDYVIVMAYDEHWGSSSGSGSVASLPWVESNLQKLLAKVPNQKLVLGVPLYSRLWKEQVNSDGTKELSSKALTMDQVKQWLKEYAVTPVYDPKTGQNYAEYFNAKENATYKIWIEDDLSLKKRSDLYGKYHLAGIASWARYFADQTAWTALDLNSQKAYTKK